MGTIPELQAAAILPAVQGATGSIAVTTVTQVIDLTSMPQSPAAPADEKNPVGRYIRVTAMAGDVYYVTGNNKATLAAASPASRSTVTGANQLQLTSNEMVPIPQGGYIDVLVPLNGAPAANGQNPQGSASACRYIALACAAGTAVATLNQSSP